MKVKRELIRFAMVIIINLVFALTVHPTSYVFEKSEKAIVKINRLTGTTLFYVPGRGWDINSEIRE